MNDNEDEMNLMNGEDENEDEWKDEWEYDGNREWENEK